MNIFDPILLPRTEESPPVLIPTTAPVQRPLPLQPIPVPQDRYTTVGFMAATLTIASAASIGSNMVDVRNGTMDTGTAVINGLAKGAAASLILSLTPKDTSVQIGLTAAALAGAGYYIDRAMKKNKQEICEVRESADS